MTARVFVKVSGREVRSNDGVAIKINSRFALTYWIKDHFLVFRREHAFIRGIHYTNFILIDKNLTWINSGTMAIPVTEEALAEIKRDLRTALALLGSDCGFINAEDLPFKKVSGGEG